MEIERKQNPKVDVGKNSEGYLQDIFESVKVLNEQGKSRISDETENRKTNDEEIESFTAENFEADVTTNDEPTTETDQGKDEL